MIPATVPRIPSNGARVTIVSSTLNPRFICSISDTAAASMLSLVALEQELKQVAPGEEGDAEAEA